MNAEGERVDVVIVGAGHNGLTCAGYLARKGLKVKLVERRGVVGGAAVTEEFHPGGGATGVPGHNAAHEMLRDFRKGRLERGWDVKP